MTKDGWDFYQRRVEPRGLKRGSKYIDLRTSTDAGLLRKVERVLIESGFEDPVLLPWVSRPFFNLEGYGVYPRREANILQERAEREEWGDPIPAEEYDLAWIRWSIDDLVSRGGSQGRRTHVLVSK